MANENKAQQNIQETASSLRAGQAQAVAAAANTQEANKAFKESVNLLNKMNKLLDDSVAKTQAFEKSTINVKKLQQEQEKIQRRSNSLKAELDRANQRDLNKASNYLKSIKERKKIEAELAVSSGATRTLLQSQLNTQNRIIDLQERRMANEVEQLAIVAKMQSQEGLKERISNLEYEIELEKDIAKQVGITGKILSFSAKYLGVGKGLQSKIVEETRKGTSFTKIFVDTLGLGSLTLFGILKSLKAGFDYIVGIQDQTVKFARAMNISTGEARQIKGEFASLSVSSGDLFINTQKMVESQMEMVDALGVTNRLSNEILATNIKLKDIAGLDLETRKGIAETATITGQNSEQLTKSILAQVVGLKQATGIQFQNQKILKEAASQSGYLGLQFAKYPAQLTKSLLTVKAMGMELKQLDSMADSFLDFESSISKEFEAQLLTGKQINLNRARELFLNNDLAGAAAEITKQVGSANDFLKLNRIQADSLASAFGMSRDQMGEMLKQQELLSRLGAKQGDSAREQLRLGLERYKSQKALTAAIGEEAYQSLVNASLQEKISAFIEKIKQSIADFVERSGIIDKIEGFIKYISEPENIRRVVIMIRDVFAQIVELVSIIASGIVSTLNFFGAISDQKAASAQSFLSGADDRIRSLGGDFGGVAVSGNVAKSEVGSGTTTQTSMSMSGKPDNLNINVTAVLDDRPQKAEARYTRTPLGDHKTGPLGP